MGNDMWGTGEGRGGKERYKQHENTCFFFLGPILQLVRGFLY